MKHVFAALLALLVACGDSGGKKNNDGGTDPTGDGGDPTGDGGNTGDGGPTADAPPIFNGDGGVVGPQTCTAPIPANPQCSNCIDDDGDGRVDGYDVECSGGLDDDESSFSTGIPGDNMDAVNQDCFFDGNSGAGNDGCNIHVCCLLGAQTVQACPIGANQYDPAECPPPIGTTPLSQMCIDTCGDLTPAGCDCFGCCTICDPTTNDCRDVITNPNTAPNCDETTINDPQACPTCTKVPSCGGGTCGGQTCVLCPGQDPNDLPPECNGMNECPNMEQSCSTTPCPEGFYCSNGCCIQVIL